MLKKLNLSLIPSWTGGVPRPIDEVNRARRGGGIKLWIKPPPRLQTLALLGLDPPLLSRRGIFENKLISKIKFSDQLFINQ